MKFNELKKIALNKTQMRAIKGGGNCGAVSGSGSVICNVTKEQAQFWAVGDGAHWCCDSCGSSSYC
ncbi:TIGR04149 family rSAM-modified RiPP [Bacteroides fluxus]|uniref:TIGR04149 family rSAM-modified RiPP n=1 Tax=Bacteroides fluxus TaxID=626930 RepID=UPI002A81BA91|nr:TIGR04149 family rSAM-modified RiPP [Bacteroides fluxus]MDY3789716.1 TIGR04149 family rSAM-modified RiPP [Bacteroides fluxus]